MKKTQQLQLILLLFFTALGYSQDGSIDTTFGFQGSGMAIIDIDPQDENAQAMAQQSDGKLLVVGSGMFEGVNTPVIVRLLSNGDIDTSFGNNGLVWGNYNSYGIYYYITIQEDDKIIVGTPQGNDNKYTLTRYLPEGEKDVSFGINGDLIPFDTNLISKMELLTNDSFIIINTIIDDGIDKLIIKRFLSNGDLDLSFGNNGIVITAIGNESNTHKGIRILDDGSFIALVATENNGVQSKVLIKYLSTGEIDSTYGSNGIVTINLEPNFSIRSMDNYNDGKMAILSSHIDGASETIDTRIFRYLPNGDVDMSFAENGVISIENSLSNSKKIIVQHNQRLLLFYPFYDFFEGASYMVVKRYNLDGTTDNNFNFQVIGYYQYSKSFMLQNDGKIVCFGNVAWTSSSFVLQRFNNNPLSISENTINTFSVFPNPSNGIFKINHRFISSETNYQLTDVTGKLIQAGFLKGEQIEINLSQFQNGIYLFTSEGSTVRLIKK